MRKSLWSAAARLTGWTGEKFLDLSDWCLARARRVARRRPWLRTAEQDFD